VASGNGDQEGNGEDSCLFSPGSANGVISVSATNVYDQVASFSNFGSCVTLFAPGVDVRVAEPHSNEYTVVSGTSFAAPIVTGTIALAMGEAGPLPPNEVQKRLINATTKNAISELKPRTTNLLVNIDLDSSVYIGGVSVSNRANHWLIYTMYVILVMTNIWMSSIVVHL
jgi:subtilisin family serine protease